MYMLYALELDVTTLTLFLTTMLNNSKKACFFPSHINPVFPESRITLTKYYASDNFGGLMGHWGDF